MPIASQHEPATGARPTGTSTPDSAAANIQAMFDTIAPTYDRANHLLSAGLDRLWWTRAARTLRPLLARPQAVILDLCCGTGDMTLALDKYRPQPWVPQDQRGTAKAIVGLSSSNPETPGIPAPTASPGWVGDTPGAPFMTASPSWVGSTKPAVPIPAPILALDFSHEMLSRGVQKFTGRNIVSIEADALHLPLADASVDLVTSAFGFRNLASYPTGLAEIFRVLRPAGELAILECNQPDGLVGALYSFYFHRILPTLGGLISGTPRAYAYLPDSVSKFPRPPRMKQLLTEAGFIHPAWTSYTLGTVGLYRATKP